MKIRAILKDTNVMAEGLLFAEDRVAIDESSLTEDERKKIKKWIRRGEFVEIEIDMDSGSAKVIPADGGE